MTKLKIKQYWVTSNLQLYGEAQQKIWLNDRATKPQVPA